MCMTLEIGQKVSLIESWSPVVLDAAINDYFDVDDGTIDFNINMPHLKSNRLKFDFDDISSTMLLKRLIIRHPDVMEYFTVYKPILVHYALDHNRDLNEFGFNVPLEKLKEAILYKLKTLRDVDYFLELLTLVATYEDSNDSDISEIMHDVPDKQFRLDMFMDCTYFLKILKITKSPKTFKMIMVIFHGLLTQQTYIKTLQLEKSLASNIHIKELIGFDCIEYLIMMALKRQQPIHHVEKQIILPKYQRVINKYKLLYGNTMKS